MKKYERHQISAGEVGSGEKLALAVKKTKTKNGGDGAMAAS